jgi:hypothetical protein
MSYLTELLGGKAENDLERAVDRFFLNQSIMNVTGYLINGRGRRPENDIEDYLTGDSLTGKLRQGATIASWLHKPAKIGLSKLLML